ncbi:MAG: GntR family transcriptional regulator [Candidatus Dactylopiibacterium carminicum]|uniref:GntR family transcriptional regulator n=1 Tax=Candidatus Dactylopiibacterium carminicum TaxID=857335 RepID=A0A272ETD8_9RHOO|nr:PLP-dependent aminotransferase family protein [Candidatus Dactylopiibacterium carminicum]KAF7599384.1 PLP-dependent aminotransferase family protein [Candidatus Dactylopiibacterium carminicum]PAS93373.1 MAG: GntR family transcriptional regulator [Candidatus Dactylopiibacterium carminicum]
MEHAQPLQLASRTARLKSSLVRDILAAAARPGMISFAGGLPAADLMPALPVAATAKPELYQYGTSEGEPAYRTAVAAWVGETGLKVSPDQVLALAGSQQGLDFAAKLLIDEGTPLLCEGPTYVAALQVFQLFGADVACVPLGAEGPDLVAFEHLLETKRPRAAYLIPCFQNPGGACYSPEARVAVAALLDRYNVLLIEDEPYRSVALDVAHPMTPICALLQRAPWIYLGSFSKILWPGWRLGFLAAHPALMQHLVRLKQAADLHTQRPGQAAVAHWLGSDARTADLERLLQGYRLRRDAMQLALQRHFGDIADWTMPCGGLFFWLRLRDGLEATRATLDRAIARGVAFMPGEAFFVDPAEGRQYLRLNYSRATPEEMMRGLELLADCIHARETA